MKYSVTSFGQDCLGNCTGWRVVDEYGSVHQQFVGDIYKPDEREAAHEAALSLCASLNEPDPIVSDTRLPIDEDYGTEIYIRTIFAQSCLGLRRAVRELNPGHIPIHSPYDCTGLVCAKTCKFLKIYKTGRGYTAVVEISVTRDV